MKGAIIFYIELEEEIISIITVLSWSHVKKGCLQGEGKKGG